MIVRYQHIPPRRAKLPETHAKYTRNGSSTGVCADPHMGTTHISARAVRANASQNDGPESHYIGNLWYEANNDTQPNLYMFPDAAPHTSAQGVITSFITAFKNGEPASSMRPVSGTADGFMWYKTVFQSVACADNGVQQYCQYAHRSNAVRHRLIFALPCQMTLRTVLRTVKTLFTLPLSSVKPKRSLCKAMELPLALSRVPLVSSMDPPRASTRVIK